MVKAADLWEGDNVAGRGRLYGPGLGAILAEREMCSASVVIFKVCRQHTAQVTPIGDDNVIETFATNRADDAFDIDRRGIVLRAQYVKIGFTHEVVVFL